MPEAASGSERSDADRRMARYKEERRRQLATQIASRLSSAASSSDEEESDKVSYTEYRRRRRKKDPPPPPSNGSLSSRSTKLDSSSLEKRSRRSPEHIYQSIGSEIGVPPAEADSGRSVSPSSRRFVSREGSLENLGAPPVTLRTTSLRSLSRERTNAQNDANDKSSRRKSVLNTSYSSEEVPGTGSTGSEGACRSSRSTRLPPTGHNPNHENGFTSVEGRDGIASPRVEGRDGLASPDIIKSVSTRITPPVSPHHSRVARDWSTERKAEHVISDPLVDKWPPRIKKNNDDADRRTRKFSDLSLPASKALIVSNQLQNGATQTLNGMTQPESPGSVLSPSTTSPNKPPIFPSPDRSSNGFKISLKRPQESPSFLRKDSKSDSEPPPFMREFASVVRRRSNNFNPDDQAPPRPTELSPRPHSVYRMESPSWNRQSDPELSSRDHDKERRKSDFLSRYEDLTNKAAEAIRTVDTYTREDNSHSRSAAHQVRPEQDFLFVHGSVEDPLTPDVEFNEELVLKTCQEFLEDYDRKREGQSPEATPPRSTPSLPATPPRSTPTLPIPAPRLSLTGLPRAAGRPVSQLSLEDEQLLIAAQHKKFWEGNAEDPVTSSRETSEDLMRAEPVVIRDDPKDDQLLSVRVRSSSLTLHDKRSPVMELRPILKKSSEDLVGSSQPPGASILKHRDDSLSSILKRRSAGEETKCRSTDDGKTDHVRIRSPSPDSRNERVRIRSPSPDFEDQPRPIIRSRNSSLCDDRASSPEIQSILKRRFSQDDIGVEDYRPSSPEHTTSILKRKSSFGSGSHSPEGVIQDGTQKSILKKSSRNSSRTCSRSGSQEELDIDPDDSEDWSRSSRPKSILKKKPGSTDDELDDRPERPKSILKSRKSEESLSPGSEASLLPDTPTHSILREANRTGNRTSVSLSDGEEVLVTSAPLMSTSPSTRASILKYKEDRPQHSILKRREKSASPCREGRASPEPCPSRDSFISTQSTESSYKTADSELEDRGERVKGSEEKSSRTTEDRVKGLEERARFLEERASSLEEQGSRGRGIFTGVVDTTAERRRRGSRHLTQPITTEEVEVANMGEDLTSFNPVVEESAQDSLRLSITERVRLFESSRRPPSSEPGLAKRPRRRRTGARYQTQPITVDEVEVASNSWRRWKRETGNHQEDIEAKRKEGNGNNRVAHTGGAGGATNTGINLSPSIDEHRVGSHSPELVTDTRSSFSTESKCNITTQPRSNFPIEHRSIFTTEPRNILTPEPRSNFTTEPRRNITTERKSSLIAEPRNSFSTEPRATITTEPRSSFNTEPCAIIPTEPRKPPSPSLFSTATSGSVNSALKALDSLGSYHKPSLDSLGSYHKPTVAFEDQSSNSSLRPSVAWEDQESRRAVTTSPWPTLGWEDANEKEPETTSSSLKPSWEDKPPSVASVPSPTPAQRKSISQTPPRSVASPPPPRPSSNPPPLPSSSAILPPASSPPRLRKHSSSPPPQYRSSSSPIPQYRSSSSPPLNRPPSSPPAHQKPPSSPPRSRSPRQTSSSPQRSPSPSPGPVPKSSPPLRRRSSERNSTSWSPDEERIGGILKRETTTSSCEDIHSILKDSREYVGFPDYSEPKAPKRSILKHESFDGETVPNKGVLKKDPSYEAPPPDTESAANARIVSCSSSSEDIAKTFSDVIIDPIPGAGRRSAPETPVKKSTGSRTPVIPRSSVKISADGDLASKLEKLTVDAENIKLRMSSSNSTSKTSDRSVSPPADPAAPDTKSTLTSSSSKSTSSKLSPTSSKPILSPSSDLPPPSSSSRPSRSPSHPRRSSRSSTTELPTAADFYAIYQQQVKSKRSPSPAASRQSLNTAAAPPDAGISSRSSDERGSVRRRSASPQFRQGVEHWEKAVEEGRRGRSQERRSDNKENEADNMPEKKEIKVQGGGILDRLASLQKSGEEDWKRRSPKLKAECPELIINKEGSGDAPVLLRKNVGREMTLERPVSMVLNKPVVQDTRPASLVDRLSKLTTAQNDWQKKVGAKDTSKFTVAGKMEHDKIIKSVKSGEPLDRKDSVKKDNVVRRDRAVTPVRQERSPNERKTPKMVKFRGRRDSSESSDEVKDVQPARMRPVSCIVESETSTNTSPFHRIGSFNKRVSLPETSAPDVSGAKTVSVPKQDNQHLDAFFQSSLATVEEQSVFSSSGDLDLVKGEPLLACPKVRARPRRTRASRNPLRVLASRELPDSYRELNSGVAEREVRRINKEKVGKHSHLAVEALAGLASTEDFNKVQLRKGTAVPHQNMLPYRDMVLLQVKGRRFCQCRVVAPSPSSMNSGDCYILVTPTEVFNWQGRFSNVIERARSAEVALSIYQKKDMGCKSASQVHTIEEDKLVQCSRENRKFWKVLTEKEETGEVREAGPPEEDEEYETAIVEAGCVYEVDVDNDELVPVPEGWGTTPKHSLLNPTKVLVFDFGSEVYVYNGRNAPFEGRKTGTRLATELWRAGWDYTGCAVNPAYGVEKDMKVESRPSWTILGRINSQMETIVFREKFIDWPDKTRVIGTRAGRKDKSDAEVKQINSWADLAGFSGREMSRWEVSDPDLELENSHLGRGRGYYDKKEMRQYEITTLGVKAWHVNENNVVELGEEWKSQFHSGDTYVVRWTYKVALTGRTLKGAPSKHLATGRNRCAYFFWQGSSSRLTEQGTSALMTVELDKERGPQLRVEQCEEPAAFLSLWGGAMVTHSGRRGESAGRDAWRMYIVRGEMEEETCLLEVDCSVASLRSRAAFVLVNVGKNKVMTWAGHLAQAHHKEMADKAADRLKSSPPKEMGFGRSISVSKEKTGKEGSGFWEAVKGSGAGYADMASKDVAGSTPRLFEMTSVSGQFEVTEITSPFRRVDVLNPLPFEQATLYKAEQPALFLLDCGTCLWLWQGWTPQDDGEGDSPGTTGSGEVRYNAERRAAMQTALDYRHAQHGTPPPPARLVWAGHEPQVFINHFPTWSVRHDVTRINQENIGDENLETVHNELSRTEYSWEELQQRPLPPGVDPARIQNYIKEQLFLEKFKMTKSEFTACPQWKQTEMKKEHGLF